MFDRRSFLKGLGGSGAVTFAGGTSILAALGNSSAYAAEVSGYKAIVCLFFFGGQDCHDIVLPFDQVSYDRYAELRTGILSQYAALEGGSSRDRDRLLTLTPTNDAQFGGRQFGLPEGLAPLKTLFDQGNAAIVGNVGPLIEPVTSTEFDDKSKPLPDRLFSHNDQQSTWISSAPEGEVFGWGGKLLDAANGSNANQNAVFSGISTFGNSVFLSGEQTQQYILNTQGPPEVNGLRNFNSGLLGTGANNQAAVQLLEDHYRSLGPQRDNLFERDIADINGRAFSSNELYSSALENATPITTEFPSNFTSAQLRAVANSINISNELGMQRQVFFVGMGGFDTHDDQARDLTRRQAEYADAIMAFYQSMEEIGRQNDVVLFTASDFGRALVENGNGTDHGWGSHHFVVGGGVSGNTIYGDIPPYDVGHEFDSGNGRLIPNVSVEQYAATLGKWFGLTDAELLNALPVLSNFATRDLGFMGSPVS